MAITINASTNRSIGLQEYIDYVEEEVDLTDLDSVLGSSSKLLSLSNNKHFLEERLCAELGALDRFQSNNSYSAQTIMLGEGTGFFVRANMWIPPRDASNHAEWETRLFTYDQAHDHNFSFLTVGHHGSGYATTIYEYDHDEIVGYPGEPVDLRFLEETTLPEGKLMFYRASRDVHAQAAPREFSVSINLLIVSPEIRHNNQYWFDLEASRIKDYVRQNVGVGRIMLCTLARYFHGPSTASALEAIAVANPLPRVRFAAYDSLAALNPHDRERIWEQALEDGHPFVAREARLRVSSL